jgi:hypothetical protein
MIETPEALTQTTPPVASAWPPYPSLYELNTWVLLSDLSRKYGRTVDLTCVPAEEWDAIAGCGFQGVWFMGVWERSLAGIAIANQNQSLLNDFRRALHDFRPEDNVGSPYCVRRYVVDRRLGGAQGLAIARRELSNRGINLILDFVPNHVAPDHPWVSEHPGYFIRGDADDTRKDPVSFIDVCGMVCACGRDPFFPAWPDVLQLNAFDSGLRRAVSETISSIAEQCDGIRCDMAMLVVNKIFERTWGTRAGRRPESEYWSELIPTIKKKHPGFLFIAEAYWDMEWELQQQGFDFCYTKKLYDRLEHGSAESIRQHLCADLSFQSKLLRFIENHDEPRAAATFSPEKQRAAAVITSTLPGARLFHEGQFDGRSVRLPVFLGRHPEDSNDPRFQEFYAKLLKAINRPVFREGQWRLCDRTGWPDNASFQNLLAWSWVKGDDHFLIGVNFSDGPVQARLQVPWADVGGGTWHLVDVLTGAMYGRGGDDLRSPGLYVDLGPWSYHLFQCFRAR